MAGKGRTVIIGTGLGGLLAGAFLASRGREVVFCEALDLVGGRFTHIDYEGFAVPTGAFHSLPGGKHGALYGCLQALGLDIELVKPDPSVMVVIEGKRYPIVMPFGMRAHSGLSTALGLRGKRQIFPRLIAGGLLRLAGRHLSMADLFRGLTPGDRALCLADHLTQFAQGIRVEHASPHEIFFSLRDQDFQGEELLRYGNRSLVTTLLDFAVQHGAQLRTRTPVARILVEDGRARGVCTTAGEEIPAELVISNAGGVRTAGMLDGQAPALARRAQAGKPAWGAGYAIRCRRRMHDQSGIEMCLELDAIAGISPISENCPALCPPDWHFSLAYQVLDPVRDVDEQLDAGRQELYQYLGRDIEIFNIAVYRDEHPAATLSPRIGQFGRGRYPARIPGVDSLFLAGQDVFGYGIAAEIIGHSSRRLWKMLE